MVNYRPTKRQILEAAKIICNSDEFYACTALERAVEYNFAGSSEFKEFFGIYVDELDSNNYGWYGEAYVEENQLARSLALLLYAEARNDVL